MRIGPLQALDEPPTEAPSTAAAIWSFSHVASSAGFFTHCALSPGSPTFPANRPFFYFTVAVAAAGTEIGAARAAAEVAQHHHQQRQRGWKQRWWVQQLKRALGDSPEATIRAPAKGTPANVVLWKLRHKMSSWVSAATNVCFLTSALLLRRALHPARLRYLRALRHVYASQRLPHDCDWRKGCKLSTLHRRCLATCARGGTEQAVRFRGSRVPILHGVASCQMKWRSDYVISRASLPPSPHSPSTVVCLL